MNILEKSVCTYTVVRLIFPTTQLVYPLTKTVEIVTFRKYLYNYLLLIISENVGNLLHLYNIYNNYNMGTKNLPDIYAQAQGCGHIPYAGKFWRGKMLANELHVLLQLITKGNIWRVKN